MIVVPYNTETVTWNNPTAGGWGWTNAVDAYGRACLISPYEHGGSGNEINHAEITVRYSGTGSVKTGVVYSSSTNLTSALSKTYYQRGYTTVQNGVAYMTPSCQYRSRNSVWVVVYPDPGVTVESVTLEYWKGYSTEYGHQAYAFMFKGRIFNVRVMFPKNMDNDKKYPLVVSGSGSGGTGTDNQRQMEMVILGRYLWTNYYHDPELECISVVPQIGYSPPAPFYPNGDYGKYETVYHPDWTAVNENGYWATALTHLLIDMMRNPEFCIDRNRLYYGGFSYGGKAIYELLKQGRRWCAGAIGCAGWPIGSAYSDPTGDPQLMHRLSQEVSRYKHVPTIIAAGGSDRMKYGSTAVYEELIKQGANSELQIYPGSSHTGSAGKCWGNRANIAKLFSWRRTRAPRDPFPLKADGTQYPEM